MGDGVEGNQSRWITLHAKKKACMESHSVALAELKLKMIPPTEIPVTTVTPTTSVVSNTIPAMLSIFWEECRKNKKMRPFVEDMEKQLKLEFDDPDDEEPYTFDPKDACERAIISASIFRKEFTKKKEEISALEYARKHEVNELQQQIKHLETRTLILETSLTSQKSITAGYAERIATLETELGLYKTKYPDPINID
jgi:hypothetical protein